MRNRVFVSQRELIAEALRTKGATFLSLDYARDMSDMVVKNRKTKEPNPFYLNPGNKSMRQSLIEAVGTATGGTGWHFKRAIQKRFDAQQDRKLAKWKENGGIGDKPERIEYSEGQAAYGTVIPGTFLRHHILTETGQSCVYLYMMVTHFGETKYRYKFAEYVPEELRGMEVKLSAVQPFLKAKSKSRAEKQGLDKIDFWPRNFTIEGPKSCSILALRVNRKELVPFDPSETVGEWMARVGAENWDEDYKPKK